MFNWRHKINYKPLAGTRTAQLTSHMSARNGWLMQSMAVALSVGSKASIGNNQSANSVSILIIRCEAKSRHIKR